MKNKTPQINKAHPSGNRHTRRAAKAISRLAKGRTKKENIRYAHEHTFEIAQRVDKKQKASHERALVRKGYGKKDKIVVS